MTQARGIFITGAAAGIGRATARHFARRDWFVGLYDIDGAGLAQLADELRAVHGAPMITTGELDVTDPDQFKEAIQAFLAVSGGRLDVLFNNAGILKMGNFDKVDPAIQRKTIDVNVNGIINGVAAALDALKATAAAHGEARIINTASASAVYGIPELTVYSASKHAVRAMTEGFSIEFEPYGIHVSDVLPSYVDTGMVKNQEHQTENFKTTGIAHTPEDIAAIVWRAAHGEDIHYFGNKQLGVMDKMARLFPGYVRKNIKKSSGFD